MSMRLLLVGSGRLTYFLGRALQRRGHELTIVSRDPAECEALARRLDATVICGDGTYASVLEDAGAGSADQVLALTPRDPDNLVTCQLAKLRFHVPRVLALANDPENEVAFTRLGIETAFSPIRVLASLIEQRAGLDAVVGLIPAAEGKVLVAEVRLEEDSPVVEHTLRDVRLPRGALVGCILRGDQPIVPHGETALGPGDRLLLISTPESQRAAIRALTGD